jgi:hypothetical protein
MITLQGVIKKIITNTKGYSKAYVDVGNVYPEVLSFGKDSALPKEGDKVDVNVGVVANYWDNENRKMIPANKTFFILKK